MLKLKQYWFGFWIWLAYLLRLRGPANSFQRWLKKEHKMPKVDLIEAQTPEEIRQYALDHKYKWRKDATRIGGKLFPLDWVTHPKVFQAKLKQDPYPGGDGDCDDYHNWFAACLQKVPGVTNIMVASSGYRGGGHSTCCYKLDGQWFHVNYKIKPIDDPNDIPQIVAEWGTDKGEPVEVTFYVFEAAYPKWKALAIGPKGKVALD